jgi:predicted Zn-dependent protease
MSRAGVAAALVGALVVCAWFALGIHQAKNTDAAAALVTGTSRLSPSQADHAASLLRSAKTLNPDRQVDVLRAELDLGQGNRAGARRILERVVAAEPQNALAWEWLARASSDDRAEFFIAAIHIRVLVPPLPARR